MWRNTSDVIETSYQDIYIYQLPTKKTKAKTFRSQRLQGAKCRYTLRPTAGVAKRVAAQRDQGWRWPSATKFDMIWISQKQIRFRVPRLPTDLVSIFKWCFLFHSKCGLAWARALFGIWHWLKISHYSFHNSSNEHKRSGRVHVNCRCGWAAHLSVKLAIQLLLTYLSS